MEYYYVRGCTEKFQYYLCPRKSSFELFVCRVAGVTFYACNSPLFWKIKICQFVSLQVWVEKLKSYLLCDKLSTQVHLKWKERH